MEFVADTRGLYILGALWFLTQFVVGLLRIFKLYKNGLKEKKQGFTLINTEGVKAPFSFFNLIFINSEIAQNADYQSALPNQWRGYLIMKNISTNLWQEDYPI